VTSRRDTKALAACACATPPAQMELDPPTNAPGQPALRYRIGAHGEFLRFLLDRLARAGAASAGLRTELRRAPASLMLDDPAVALLDAFAVMADVLTFYQERVANEAFLRTAMERQSLVELARTIGYEPAASLAARTTLAFNVEGGAGAPQSVHVPARTKVASVPGPGETPKVYETLADLVASPNWNALAPARTRAQVVGNGSTVMVLEGLTTGLRPGDVLLFVGPSRDVGDFSATDWEYQIVRTVRTDTAENRTTVGWTQKLASVGTSGGVKVYALRQRAALFGHNAPDYAFILSSRSSSSSSSLIEWPNFEVSGSAIDLDAAYPQSLVGGWVLLLNAGKPRLDRINKVEHRALAAFAISSKSTRLDLERALGKDEYPRRATTVFLESEELTLAEQPDGAPLEGNEIALERDVPDLGPGQWLVLTGRPAAEVSSPLTLALADGTKVAVAAGARVQLLAPPAPAFAGQTAWKLRLEDGRAGAALAGAGAISYSDATVGEEVEILSARRGEDGRTIATLTAELTRAFDRRTVVLYGNVVAASEGDTVAAEPLGGGDATRSFQRFKLNKSPLTYLWKDGAVVNTLAIAVDGITWTERPALHGAGPQATVYEVTNDNGGVATATFGDGVDGARLPSGTENVIAVYRVGGGLAGVVGAGKLTALLSPILGIRAVTNPLAASGGADAERLEDVRRNGPLRVTTLDRIVSLQDFEDFVRAQSGVSKASAADVWSGTTRLVHVTVALADGSSLEAGSLLERDLLAAVAAAGAFAQPFTIAGYLARRFRLEGWVIPVRGRAAATVIADVGGALRAAFGFAARSLAQAVTAAEVLAAMQQVEGVEAAGLGALFFAGDAAPAYRSVLPASPARWSRGEGLLAAELLLVDDGGITLTEGAP